MFCGRCASTLGCNLSLPGWSSIANVSPFSSDPFLCATSDRCLRDSVASTNPRGSFLYPGQDMAHDGVVGVVPAIIFRAVLLYVAIAVGRAQLFIECGQIFEAAKLEK